MPLEPIGGDHEKDAVVTSSEALEIIRFESWNNAGDNGSPE